LTQNTLLHILVLPDRGSKGIDKLFIELRISGEFLVLFDLSISEHLLMLIFKKLILNSSLIYLHSLLISFLFVLFINIDIESAFIIPDEVDHIYVCAIHVL
jgi:hypothetical protein